ncbi:hypothetical protein EIP86_006077 [Pleurotus ostreatoroseus]|nr:hypothetical protein EIP86_006077 [Pleurotus ostreatoroseus]
MLIWRRKLQSARGRLVPVDVQEGECETIDTGLRESAYPPHDVSSAASQQSHTRADNSTPLPGYASLSESAQPEITEKGAAVPDEMHRDEEDDMDPSSDGIDDASCNDVAPSTARATIASSDPNNTRPTSPAHDSSPIPPPPQVPPVQSPPPSYRAPRRRAADGGVRLVDERLSLRRVGTPSDYSVGAASQDSLTTLPPPFSASY